jgi:hypothetical protein
LEDSDSGVDLEATIRRKRFDHYNDEESDYSDVEDIRAEEFGLAAKLNEYKISREEDDQWVNFVVNDKSIDPNLKSLIGLRVMPQIFLECYLNNMNSESSA